MRRFFLATIVLATMLSCAGCGNGASNNNLLSIVNKETGTEISLGEDMAKVEEKMGSPVFYPKNNVYLYGDSNLPCGSFSAYYDYGTVSCLIFSDTKWETSSNITVGSSLNELTENLGNAYLEDEVDGHKVIRYQFTDKLKPVSENKESAYNILFSINEDNCISGVMIATEEYVQAN